MMQIVFVLLLLCRHRGGSDHRDAFGTALHVSGHGRLHGQDDSGQRSAQCGRRRLRPPTGTHLLDRPGTTQNTPRTTERFRYAAEPGNLTFRSASIWNFVHLDAIPFSFPVLNYCGRPEGRGSPYSNGNCFFLSLLIGTL